MRTTTIIAYASIATIEDALQHGTPIYDMYETEGAGNLGRATVIEIEDDPYLISDIESDLDAAYIEFLSDSFFN